MVSAATTSLGGPPASLFLPRRALLLSGAVALFILIQAAAPGAASARSPLSGFNPATLADTANGPSVNVRTFWADNALPLRAIFLDEWDGPFTPDRINNADVWWQADAGIIHDHWRFAAVYRGELFMETNRDTIEILRLINLEQELPQGRTFTIDLRVGGFTAYGGELSKGVKMDRIMSNLRGGFTVRYLNGEMVQDGGVTGNLTPTSATTYDFDLFLDYAYDKNYVYKRSNAPPGRGDGFSFDAGLCYSWEEKVTASLLFRDILGRIYWQDVPYTLADATSAVRTTDASGFQAFRPTIKGFEGFRSRTQTLPLKTDIDLAWREGAFTFSTTVNMIRERPLYWVSLDYAALPGLTVSAGYNANYEAVFLGAALGRSSLLISMDDLNPGRAKAMGVILAVMGEW